MEETKADKEKWNEYMRNYRKANSDKIKEINKNYYIRKKKKKI